VERADLVGGVSSLPVAAADARALYEQGRLDEAIQALGAALRADPSDARGRTFLFELLCFAGEYDRAEKQLDVVAAGGREAEMGAWVYRTALHAERVRQALFAEGREPPHAGPAGGVSGRLNGRAFRTLEDADPRMGARLEVFAAGQYTWIPVRHLASVRMEAPKRLRDTLWAPAVVAAGPDFQGAELGEVLLPVVAPLSWRSADGHVRLGRAADWQDVPGGRPVPVGAKLLLVDGEPLPLLEVRELEFDSAPEHGG
jgi:type VI secretion system protein ImpE